MASKKSKTSKASKKINLALQGGGAHGAFTWGVLDRLLEDGRLEIEAISGTSAGAMNAVALADGLMENGREGARERLATFWRAIGDLVGPLPWLRDPFAIARGDWNLESSPTYLALDLAKRLLSPYQTNPLNLNPVLDILGRQIDFERVRACDRTKLFISATNVRTGKIRVFKTQELTSEAVMASAALPQIYQAVEIEGEAYWDGGFMGNPAIYPLIYGSTCRDIVLLQINPLRREAVPTTPAEIADRVNEISFNSSLMREMRAIAFVSDLLDRHALGDDYKRMLIHRIEPASEMSDFGAASKLNANWAFLTHLRDLGRASAGVWLDETFDAIGERSTIDLKADYL